jgi:hypothetical protein
VDAGAEGVGASEAMPTGGGIAEDEAVVEPQTGPIDAASFAELLDSGLLDETGDAAELREALREAAATKDDELE